MFATAGTAYWILAALTGALAAGTLLLCLSRLRRDRFMADTPLVRIRSAAQGYVRLEGLAQRPPGEDLRSPLSGRACVWWDFRVDYKEKSERGNTIWRTIEQATSVTPFVLADGDGECLVGPVGAEVTATSDDRWSGSTPHPFSLPHLQSGFRLGGESEYRYHERLIAPGAKLSVLGELRSHTEFGAVDQKTQQIIALWKHDQPALLRRFDRNHDGQIDAIEWDVVRAEARDQAAATVMHSAIERVGVVAQTRHGEPFVIAPMDAKHLIRREQRNALLLLVASVLCLALCLWTLAKAEHGIVAAGYPAGAKDQNRE